MAMLAHVDAGKTTLSESILLNTGRIRQAGRVDHGDTYLDTENEERERGITIFSKQALFDLGEKHFTLIDTPGHVDFSAEMERALSVLDLAVLIISAPDGVHGHDITLWKLLENYKVPVFVFINKLDQPGSSMEETIKKLEGRFGAGFVDFSGVGAGAAELYDSVAVLDDELMERYLENGSIPDEDIIRLIRERKLFPCVGGSALKNEGVTELLGILGRFTSENVYPDEFGARVFKVTRDRAGNRLTHVKITGGSVKPKDIIRVGAAAGEEPHMEKVNRIMLLSGTKAGQLEMAEAGMVVALEGLEGSFSGGTLGAEASRTEKLMVPLFTANVYTTDDIDIHKLYMRLKELEEEIPEISLSYNESKAEIGIRLMGEVQTDIIRAIVKERFDINIGFSPSSIVYKETISAPVIAAGHFEPLRHYAEVHLMMEPGERGSGIEICTSLSEDVLPRHFQRLIMTNIGERRHRGVLTGSELTDVRITLINAKAHEKHTEGGDFREATYRAVRYGHMKAAALGNAVLLEPYYDFELRVPDSCTGRAMTDLARITENFNGPEIEGGEAVFTGRAAVSLMQGYGREVTAYSGGFGSLSVAFGGYGTCLDPENVIAGSDYDPELDIRNQSGSVFCAHGAGYYVPWYEADQYFHLDIRAEEAALTGAITVKKNLESVNYSAVTKKDETAMFLSGYSNKNLGINDVTAGGKIGTLGKANGKTDYLGAGIAQDKELEEIFNRSLGANRGKDDSEGAGWKRPRREGSSVMKGVKPAKGAAAAGADGHVEIASPKKQYLLVDGYNIIFAWDELRSLAADNIDAARARLQDILANYQGYRGMTLILVFDAYKVRGGMGSVEKYHNIYVVYTKEAQTADAYIEKTVHEIGHKERVTVATSDGLEQTIVFGEGAVRMSARELYAAVMSAQADISSNFVGRTGKLENRMSCN